MSHNNYVKCSSRGHSEDKRNVFDQKTKKIQTFQNNLMRQKRNYRAEYFKKKRKVNLQTFKNSITDISFVG